MIKKLVLILLLTLLPSLSFAGEWYEKDLILTWTFQYGSAPWYNVHFMMGLEPGVYDFLDFRIYKGTLSCKVPIYLDTDLNLYYFVGESYEGTDTSALSEVYTLDIYEIKDPIPTPECTLPRPVNIYLER